MVSINVPRDLPTSGYSRQAAAMASTLVQHPDAALHRATLRLALDAADDPQSGDDEDFDKAQTIAELLTDMARIGSGMAPSPG